MAHPYTSFDICQVGLIQRRNAFGIIRHDDTSNFPHSFLRVMEIARAAVKIGKSRGACNQHDFHRPGIVYDVLQPLCVCYVRCSAWSPRFRTHSNALNRMSSHQPRPIRHSIHWGPKRASSIFLCKHQPTNIHLYLSQRGRCGLHTCRRVVLFIATVTRWFRWLLIRCWVWRKGSIAFLCIVWHPNDDVYRCLWQDKVLRGGIHTQRIL